MSNSVPSGWGVKNLIDCSVNGISNGVFRDPKTVGEGYKLINVFEMYQGFGVDVNLTERLPLSDKEFQKNKVNYGDVFFTRSSLKLEGIAYCNINLSHDDDITYEGHLMRVVPDRNFVEPEYLARFCLSDEARIFFMSSAKHSSMTTISQSDIAPLKVLLPPLPEQQKIAAIFTSVDDVIESTQAQINKLKDLKTGMMQELLTKGIGHTEFKDSVVGRIPKGWTTSTIGELAEQVKPGPFGSAITKSMYVESGYKVYGQEQVIAGNMKVGNYYIDKEKFDELSVFKVDAGEILISLVGTFGQVLVVPEEFEEGIINPRLLKLRMPKNKVSPYFIAHQLKSEFVVDQLNKFQQGGTMGVLSGSTLKPVKLVVPPYDEQVKITNILSNFDLNIEAKERKKIQLINSKKALMQDLLTGKVRVKVN